VNSDQWKKLNESPELMVEMIAEMSSTLNKDDRFGKSEKTLSVNELRKELDDKGLDADGSKDMLLSRLQESNKGQATDSGPQESQASRQRLDSDSSLSVSSEESGIE